MKYKVNKNTHPVYLQIYKQIKEDIINGYYPYNTKLPSKRLLADETDTSTVTIEHAYALLCDEGYVESRERSGFFVIFRKTDGFSLSTENDFRNTENNRQHHINPEFPFSVLAKTMRAVISDLGEDILEKSENKGCTQLRFAIKHYLAKNRGISVDTEQIIIGSGAEYLYSLISKRRNTIIDGSALVTGMLFAMTLPSTVPYWIPAVGSALAIIVAKLMCGGLGQNIFNPALFSRALMLMLFPAALTRYPAIGVDAVSSSTPLHHMVMPALPEESILDMFLGNCPGSIGEISALALLIGGAYLVYRKVISLRIPASYILTVAVLTLIFHKTDAPIEWMLYSLFSGGLMLGAIFMATDYATSPVTPNGQLIFGVGCGLLTVLIRYFGGYPEGVSYAILIMNLLTWAIDKATPQTQFGISKADKKVAEAERKAAKAAEKAEKLQKQVEKLHAEGGHK